MNITLVLTHDCNLRCRYCYAGKKWHKPMTWDVAKRALDQAFGEPSPWMDLSFFGGEPLIEFGLLKRALAYAKEQAAARGVLLRPQLTTNGTMLTEEVVEYVAAENILLGLSLDGCREAHEATRPGCGGASSFDAVVAGLDRVLARGLRVEVIAVVDPANVRWLAQSVAFLADRRVPRISLNPNFTGKWTDGAAAELERQYRLVADDYVARYRAGRPMWVNVIDGKIISRLKKGFCERDKCGFGVREIAVAPGGNLYPCERLVGEDTDEAIRMGNVFDGIDRAKQAEYRRLTGNSDPECAKCALRNRCMNWCACTNYSLTGAIDRAGGIVCFHEQLAIREADRAAALLFEAGQPEFLKRQYHVEAVPCA